MKLKDYLEFLVYVALFVFGIYFIKLVLDWIQK